MVSAAPYEFGPLADRNSSLDHVDLAPRAPLDGPWVGVRQLA